MSMFDDFRKEIEEDNRVKDAEFEERQKRWAEQDKEREAFLQNIDNTTDRICGKIENMGDDWCSRLDGISFKINRISSKWDSVNNILKVLFWVVVSAYVIFFAIMLGVDIALVYA